MGRIKHPSLILFIEVLAPFLIAGLGMVCAGLLLEHVQHSEFYQKAPQALVLLPALLGLKGNLEMTLASRLSTQSNTDKMESYNQIKSIVLANMALDETQALVVTLLATAAAMTHSWILSGQLDIGVILLVASAALTAASLTSLFLSSAMIVVVLVAKRFKVNPDNVATPIAASLGDLTTLLILSGVGNFLEQTKSFWPRILALLFFLMFLPLCAIIAWRNVDTRKVLYHGWLPIIIAMLISTIGGFVSAWALKNCDDRMALYQPAINGVGGNLAAVASSKLSTFYHRTSVLGILPKDWTLCRFCSIRRAFFSADEDSHTACVLLVLCLPGHLLFYVLITVAHQDAVNPLFTALYLFAALTQVAILLFLCQWLVPLMWVWQQDPDNCVIPYLTSMGDLMGISFLTIAFRISSL